MVGFSVNLDTFGQLMSTLMELAYDVADEFFGSEKIQKLKQKPKERSSVQTHT